MRKKPRQYYSERPITLRGERCEDVHIHQTVQRCSNGHRGVAKGKVPAAAVTAAVG